MDNVTGFIERDSNGVTLEVANIDCYIEVLTYDVTTRNQYQLVPEDRASNISELCSSRIQVRECGDSASSTGERVWW